MSITHDDLPEAQQQASQEAATTTHDVQSLTEQPQSVLSPGYDVA